MIEFLSMGGYASYIWSSYGAVSLAMIVLLVLSVRGARKMEREASALQALSPRRRRRQGDEA
ncbi:MAG: heme exporter protein CcmD [Minwuia sp.]|uniref:heme exporter protein CcmD n=1 Tax=Minwuia sp. TaxID=2493630 RepID=UPI003A8B7BDA